MNRWDVAALVIAVLGTAVAWSLIPEQPRLAGYGCAGVSEGVVLYREHEDEFPVCERIEVR